MREQLSTLGNEEVIPGGVCGLQCVVETNMTQVEARSATLRDISDEVSVNSDIDQSPQLRDNFSGIIEQDLAYELNNLGKTFYDKFLETNSTEYINEAIRAYQESVNATQEHHSKMPSRINDLGGMYTDRFLRTGDIRDVDKAIGLHKKALSLVAEGDTERPDILDNLGLAYHHKCTTTGEIHELDEAFKVHQDAVQETAKGHPKEARRIHNLGLVYHHRFQWLGSLSDLDKAVQTYQQAVDATSTGHKDRAGWVHNLAIGYGDKFQVNGQMTDLDRSINLFREAMDATPANHIDRARRLDSLGLAYGNRYERIGAMEDLNEAIRLHQESISATPKDHPNIGYRFESLGLGYADRFKRTGEEADLYEALRFHEKAVDATPTGHVERPGRVANLASVYLTKYNTTKPPTMSDLDRSIELHIEAIDATPQDSPDRFRRINGLGLVYQDKFQISKLLSDLDTAIEMHKTAVRMVPEGHPDRSDLLLNIGNGYRERFRVTGSVQDRLQAIEQYEEALDHTTSPIRSRLSAGKSLLRLYVEERPDWPMAYQTASKTVSFIPLLTPQSIENSDKQYLLIEAIGLASDAAAVALMAGKSPYEAIQLLETARGVIVGSLVDMRTDISDLQEHSPRLAQDYIKLRDELDRPTDSWPMTEETGTPEVLRQKIDRRYIASQQLDQTLKAIRDLPGFSRFLLSPNEDEIKAAAVDGPIVIINVSEYGSDALIIEETSLRALRLPQLRHDDVRIRAKTLAKPEIIESELLEWLWETVASPVLGALGFVRSPKGDWPRIWWIPTGLLAKFPIHAAGYHSSGSNDTVLDRAISSYSSSIKALIHSRQNRPEANMPWGPENIVLLGMEETPGHSALQFVSQEMKELERLFDSTQLQVRKPQPFRQDVLTAVSNCKIFHFAGHGLSDPLDPSRSALLLNDEPLTVTSLFETNLRSRRPFLAYLSACGTGQVRHDGLVDEGLHLVGACQLAGFQHVVGTLWEVNDASCVDITVMTYEWIQKQNMSDGAVSEGLHRACIELRRRWVSENIVRAAARRERRSRALVEQFRSKQSNTRELRDVEAGDDEPLYWVPYVHFGI
ncbi:CHAT domain-containing protein [Hypomontagnella monticulosa]|nr:CHAT domain-containing protein [Hypomontagnella monticulosa]